jgi:hypothetical protein
MQGSSVGVGTQDKREGNIADDPSSWIHQGGQGSHTGLVMVGKDSTQDSLWWEGTPFRTYQVG